jgi:hypothetical protein
MAGKGIRLSKRTGLWGEHLAGVQGRAKRQASWEGAEQDNGTDLFDLMLLSSGVEVHKETSLW